MVVEFETNMQNWYMLPELKTFRLLIRYIVLIIVNKVIKGNQLPYFKGIKREAFVYETLKIKY